MAETNKGAPNEDSIFPVGSESSLSHGIGGDRKR